MCLLFLSLAPAQPELRVSQWLSGKEYTFSAGDVGSIPGRGRSAGEGNGSPLQYSGPENPVDRGPWLAVVHGVAKEPDMTEELNKGLSSVRSGSDPDLTSPTLPAGHLHAAGPEQP